MNGCVHGAPPFSPPLILLSEAPAVPRTSDSEKSSLDWRYYLLVQAQEEGEEVKRRTSSQEGNKDSFYGICANKVPKLHCKHEPPENIWSECPNTALSRQRVGTNAKQLLVTHVFTSEWISSFTLLYISKYIQYTKAHTFIT